MQDFPNEFYQFLNENTLVEVKGGLTRPTFLPIWMVNVNNRIFARSWNKSEKSWFTEFQKSGVGEIKFGENYLVVNGEKLAKDDLLQTQIDQAYLKKYTQPGNEEYAKGIAQPEYHDYTMEFFVKKPE